MHCVLGIYIDNNLQQLRPNAQIFIIFAQAIKNCKLMVVLGFECKQVSQILHIMCHAVAALLALLATSLEPITRTVKFAEIFHF
jgi:hypothetical protein